MRSSHIILHHHRSPDVERDASKTAAEVLRSDSDDGEVVFVQGYRLSDNVGIGAKTALPQPIANYHNRVRIWDEIFVGQERAPDRCFHSKHVKVVTVDDRS